MTDTAQPAATHWDALRLLRSKGQRPALPVIVTTNPRLPDRLWGVGCLVILYVAGEPMPVKLLEGLDVILMLDTCDLGRSVFRLAEERGVKFERLRAWCRCSSMLVVAPIRCDSYQAYVDWAERKPHAT